MGEGFLIFAVILAVVLLTLKDRLAGKRPTIKLSNYEPDNRPGRFLCKGVDRQTHCDVTDVFQADSAANAKVKAELKGIIVTSVERT